MSREVPPIHDLAPIPALGSAVAVRRIGRTGNYTGLGYLAHRIHEGSRAEGPRPMVFVFPSLGSSCGGIKGVCLPI